MPIVGTLGDLIFYKTVHGHLVRRKGTLDKERVMNDPAFEKSRAAGSEFGRAGSGSAMIRKGITQHIPYACNGQTHARLSKLLGEIIRMDTEHPKGARQVLPANLAPLKSFEWIENNPLARAFWASCGGSMTPEGTLTITMPGFSPKRDLGWPVDATHAQITVVCLAIDFEGKEAHSDASQSALLMKSALNTDLSFSATVPIREGIAALAGIGVQFFKDGVAMTEGSAFGLVG
jgi:hypothetical protein